MTPPVKSRNDVRTGQSWAAVLAVVVMGLCSVLLYARWASPRVITMNEPALHEQSKNNFKLDAQIHATRQPTTLVYRWRITSAKRRPDGVLKQVFLINGQFPGPTIEAQPDDHIVIEVVNALEDPNENISIHWHGLAMRGYNNMDGAVGITQDAIPPGQNFTYDFHIAGDQVGTFWYHAHSSVQRIDGLHGGLIVHEPVSNRMTKGLPNEYLLMLGDWYHRPAEDVLGWYLNAESFGMEPVPDSVLINGKGRYPCDNAVPARPVDCKATSDDQSSLHFDGSSTSRLRIINVGAYSGLSMVFKGAEIRLLTVDGGNLVDSHVSRTIGVLHPGERVDVLVHWTSKTPIFSLVLSGRSFKYENPALDSEQSFKVTLDNEKLSALSDHEPPHAAVSLNDLRPAQSEVLYIRDPDLTLMVYTMTEKLARLNYVPHGNINRTIWKPQSPPLISSNRQLWDESQFVPHIPYRKDKPLWVDIVINNLDEEDHPFHLHGHDFFVMSIYSSPHNWGSFNPFDGSRAPGGAFATHPIRKDTVAVPRRGYAVLRFEANNPGIWMFHCHVIWHLASGMAMAFDVS